MEEDRKHGSEQGNDAAIKVKVPKRVLHFSDGVMEEYSEDEVDNDNAPQKEDSAVVDPVSTIFTRDSQIAPAAYAGLF